MTAMTPEAPVRALDEILRDVLDAPSSLDRLIAYGEGERCGYGGALIADYCTHCTRGRGPWVVTFGGLLRHLMDTDGSAFMRIRGRWHTPDNVHVWTEEDGGHGHALGRGPGPR